MHTACAFLNTEGGWLFFGVAPTSLKILGFGRKANHGGLPKERCRSTYMVYRWRFVVVTFMRPTKEDTQDVPQGVPQSVPQGVPQGKELDIWIKEQIEDNPQITTEELAKLSGYTSKTIKRHILKLTYIKYVGSGYSGHWEITDDNEEE